MNDNATLRKRFFIFAGAIVAVLIIFCLLFFGLYTADQETIPSQNKEIQQNIDREPWTSPEDLFEPKNNIQSKQKWFGLCAKDSVYDKKSFMTAVMKDPVLKKHFESFRWEQFRMGILENNVRVLIHYRIGDNIYQSPKIVLLPKGDKYITDGNFMVRMSCCNSYEILPIYEEVNLEPAAGPTPSVNGSSVLLPLEENIPKQLTEEVGNGEQVKTIVEVVTIPPTNIPPIDFPPPDCHDCSDEHDKPKPPQPVPDPPTIWLMATGLAGVLSVKRKIK